MMLPTVQKPAPDFSCTAMLKGEFAEISQSDYRGKYLFLFFYPMDFTFVCPTEILGYSDRAQEFRDKGCEVVGCSVDSQYTHLAWYNTPRAEGGIADVDIPLLADVSHRVGKSYGVLTDEGVALRASFLMDKEGILRHMLVNDLPVGRSVEESLRTLDALQCAEEHGEVCPADWRPGEATLTPEPQASKRFFAERGR